jgi:hypothetical protein
LVVDRLKDGFDVDDFKAVHRNMYKAWGDCDKMSRYLRPLTLYRSSKFEGYINYKQSESHKIREQEDMMKKIRQKAGLE